MSRREKFVLAFAGLGTFVLRLVNIGALPVFNDEAIYLRWAQHIARHPSFLFAIPLEDPKPPFHFALLALFVDFVSDPLLAARVLSAIAGAVTVVFAMLVVKELGGAMRTQIAAAVLFAFCPYLAFHQRLAAADALFIAEAMVAVWFALRRSVVGVGVTMGVAMLTRQIVSYSLWAIPIVTMKKRVIPAMLLAGVLWSPFLVADRGRYSQPDELRRRVFYKQEFRQSFSIEQMVKNARSVHEWLWVYLTPPVYLGALLSIFMTRKWVLHLWLAIGVLPLVFFGAVTWPRYGLYAVPPLLLMLALAIGRWKFAPILVVALSVLPVRETARQIIDWKTQTLVPVDRWQHVSGWPAGFASERAIAYFKRHAPCTIITGAEWGLPADAMWAALDRDPRITLRWADDASADYRTDKWSPASVSAPLPESGPVFRVHRGEPQFTFEYRERLEIANPDGGDKVTIFRIR